MEITLLGFVLGILLLAVPLYILYAFRINLMQKTLVAFGKMIVWLTVTGFFLYFVLRWNNLLVNILWTVVMALAAAVMTVGKARLKSSKYIVPVFVGLITSSLVIGLFFLFFVVGLKNPFDARFFIPVISLMIGAMIGVNANALSVYYSGLEHHSALYYYLLGNGASHKEAVNYFVRRALQKAASPWISSMAYMVVGVAPLILWTMLLSGVALVTAIAYQVLILILLFSTSLVSLLITLQAARRYSFDEYDRLKEK